MHAGKSCAEADEALRRARAMWAKAHELLARPGTLSAHSKRELLEMVLRAGRPSVEQP